MLFCVVISLTKTVYTNSGYYTDLLNLKGFKEEAHEGFELGGGGG